MLAFPAGHSAAAYRHCQVDCEQPRGRLVLVVSPVCTQHGVCSGVDTECMYEEQINEATVCDPEPSPCFWAFGFLVYQMGITFTQSQSTAQRGEG